MDAICRLETMTFVMQVKVAYISNKPPLVGKHAFSLLVGSFNILVAAVGFDTFYVCSSILKPSSNWSLFIISDQTLVRLK